VGVEALAIGFVIAFWMVAISALVAWNVRHQRRRRRDGEKFA
jgi:hypothetical protein